MSRSGATDSSCMTRPRSMIRQRDASSSTTSTRCSTAPPRARRRPQWCATPRPACSTMTGASPSVGSSINNTFGLPIRARPIDSICCSPPESCQPRFFARCASPGTARTRGPRSTRRPDAHRQVLAHGEARKDLALLRHVAEAVVGAAVGWRARAIETADQNLAGMALRPSGDQLEQRALADAVAADDRHGLAGRNRQRHVLDHDGLAPAAEQAAHVKRARGLMRTDHVPICPDRSPAPVRSTSPPAACPSSRSRRRRTP